MKKYVITGSVGHISKPVIAGLVKAGKDVTVITSNADKVKEIESLGAKALTGSLFDAAFVAQAFIGAEVVYTMVPPIWQTNNWKASQLEIVQNYAAALTDNATVKYIVNLSSVGAHLGTGTGPVDAIAVFEKVLNKLSGIQVKHLRPVFFYYNLLAQLPMLKQAGIMGANYGEQKIALVDPADIAEVALAELLALNFTGNSVRYIASDERTGQEIANVLGNAIGKQFPWVVFSDEQLLKGFLDAGLTPTHAEGYVEMGASMRTGKMTEDYGKNKPAFSKTKLEDFARQFKAAYQS